MRHVPDSLRIHLVFLLLEPGQEQRISAEPSITWSRAVKKNLERGHNKIYHLCISSIHVQHLQSTNGRRNRNLRIKLTISMYFLRRARSSDTLSKGWKKGKKNGWGIFPLMDGVSSHPYPPAFLRIVILWKIGQYWIWTGTPLQVKTDYLPLCHCIHCSGPESAIQISSPAHTTAYLHILPHIYTFYYRIQKHRKMSIRYVSTKTSYRQEEQDGKRWKSNEAVTPAAFFHMPLSSTDLYSQALFLILISLLFRAVCHVPGKPSL